MNAAQCATSIPLTDEIRDDLELLSRAVWGNLNGAKLKRADRARLAHFLSALCRYGQYGHEGDCPAVMYHGPGHQSVALCDGGVAHKGPHTAQAMGQVARWRGLVAFGGHNQENFDQTEEDDEMDTVVASTVTAQQRLNRHLEDWRHGRVSGEELVIDVLTSIRQFAEVHAVDFAAADAIAYRHYVAESTGEAV